MQQPTDTLPPLDLKGITEVLVKHYDLHEGIYDVAFELHMGVGRFVMDPPGPPLPGALFGIRAISLMKAAEPGPTTVDAAIVNPAKKARARKTAE